MATPVDGSRIGCAPPARSRMERRACPSATPSRSMARWASGPLCLRLAVMRRSRSPNRVRRSSGGSPWESVKPAIPHMRTPSGGGADDLLPLHERAHLGQRVEVLRDKLGVRDLDAELLLQEGDQLQHPERIDDAVAQEGIVVGKVVHEERLDDEFPDAGAHRHPITLAGA